MKLLLHRSFFSGLFLLISIPSGFAQTTVWSDNFNNGCASNCVATTWNGWTILDNVGGTSGAAPNNWFVSCAEEGITPPGCGSSCIGDASLHVGANPGAGGDMGASYNETNINNATFRMAVSPAINTTGYSAITLQFDFIAYGSNACADDRVQLRLSTDGGATWPAGFQYCLTSVCCGSCNGYSQGQWTTYTLALPAAFDNNPNVRVGFHWMNNGNGSGTDPSAAIDDVRLTVPTSLSTDLLHFSAQKESKGTQVSWTASNEVDFSHYELERSVDGSTFSKIYIAAGNCPPDGTCDYQHKDIDFSSVVYYRLNMVDNDGKSVHSDVISLDPAVSNSTDFSLISNFVFGDDLQVKIDAKRKAAATLSLYNISGRLVVTEKDVALKAGFNQRNIDLSKLSEGVYILKVYLEGTDKVLSGKVIKN